MAELVALIKAEGDNKTYMGVTRRLGAAFNGGLQWYTPEDPFMAAHPLGEPTYSIAIHGPGWNAAYYLWDQGEYRVLEAQRTVGLDAGPPKRLTERILERIKRA